jgi:hypothetical protein
MRARRGTRGWTLGGAAARLIVTLAVLGLGPAAPGQASGALPAAPPAPLEREGGGATAPPTSAGQDAVHAQLAVAPAVEAPSTRQSQRLHAIGVRFGGTWKASEQEVILKVIDCFVLTFGQAQLHALIRAGLSVDPSSSAQVLTFIRVSIPGYPIAGWSPSTGEIVINDGLYDQAYVDARYTWPYLETAQLIAPHAVTQQEAIVAHELGHVVADGIRVRRAQSGGSRAASLANLPPDEEYAAVLNINYWPHPFEPPCESLATEIGLWALGVPRVPIVVQYRETYLSPLIYGAASPRLP